VLRKRRLFRIESDGCRVRHTLKSLRSSSEFAPFRNGSATQVTMIPGLPVCHLVILLVR